jgi:NTE family protein
MAPSSESGREKLAKEQPLVLVLGGGNALSSYLAGACEHLLQQGIEPQWIVGGSIGAVMGAIIAGNAPEDRLPRLKAFWDEAMIRSPGLLGRGTKTRHTYNELHTITTLLFGRPGLFGHRFPGMLSMLPWMPDDIALYDHTPLRQTLERLVDFDRLNRSDIRLTVGCVDLESGDEVLFDTTRDRLTPEHFLASTAITPIFPPIEIGGRLLCDPGYTNNLPLDVPFAEPMNQDFTCIAVELFSLHASRPASLDSTAERANELIFASPTRRTLKALEREYALRDQWEPDGPTATLLHLAYYAGSDERAGKTFDYSPSSIRDRWGAGKRDMEKSLALLDDAPGTRHRFRYLTLDPQREAVSAELGAAAASA